MSIGPAQPHDLDGILALEAAFQERERWGEGAWRGELDGDRRITLVARQDGGIVGVAAFEQGLDVADLHRIVVAEHARRGGVADGLLRAGLDRIEGRVLLEVREDNAPARALYEKHGFRVIDRRADYYGAGIDALVHEFGGDA